jgi:hypothetical protein
MIATFVAKKSRSQKACSSKARSSKARSPILLFLALLASGAVAAPNDEAKHADFKTWVEKTAQTLYDAVGVGDTAPWKRVIAADFIYTSEDGEVQNAAEFIAGLKPLPPGFSGGIKVADVSVRDIGGGAVAHYLLDEWEDIYGQKLHTKYLVTDTYRRHDRTWQMVASQTTVVPRDLEPVQVDTSKWPALVGEYRLSDQANRSYHVYLRDGALYAGSSEEKATSLIPLSPLVFFQKGSIHTMIFVEDAAGVITEVCEVHKYNELVMKRVRS